MDRPDPSTLPMATKTPPRPTPPKRRRRLRVGPRAFKLMWDGHSVAGVMIGLALFVIFFCGALALYRGELHQWADPALRAAATDVESVDALVGPVFDEYPPAEGSGVTVVFPFANRPYLYLGYEAASGEAVSRWISPASGAVLSGGRSAMPDLLNDLHFFHQFGLVGETLAGLVAVVLLFALISGLIIHLRKLPQDLHTFRPRKKLRTALADAHNVLGTLGLPFTVMYAVTGAFFALLMFVYGPLILGAFGGDQAAFDAQIAGLERPAYEASGEAAAPLPFDSLLERLPADWPDLEIVIVQVEGWGDRAATAFVEGQAPGTISQTGVAVLGAATGEVLAARGPEETPPLTQTVVGFGTLHFARFGGAVLKALFFFLAMAASAVILTGNLLWIEVRRPKGGQRSPRLHRLLARLTAGVGAGLATAVPMLLLATRLVPIEMEGRMAVENGVFFGAWTLLVGAAFLGASAHAAARRLLALAGGLCLLVPLANGFGTGAWLWTSAAAGWWAVFWIDVGFALGGVLLLGLARRLRASETVGAANGAGGAAL